MAALVTLQQYDRLLENEWRERTLTTLLRSTVDSAQVDAVTAEAIRNAYATWERQRPYVRTQDAGNQDYPAYRRGKFDAFLSTLWAMLPESAQAAFVQEAEVVYQESLPAYQQQMSILARLEASPY